MTRQATRDFETRTSAKAKRLKQMRMWAMLLLLVIFASGFVSGWWMQQYRASISTKKNQRSRRGQWRKRFINRLATQLKLTDKQRVSVTSILDRYRPKYRAIRSSIRPQIKQMRTDMRKDIQSILQPKQQQLFQTMIQQRKARRAKRRKQRKQ